MTNQIDYIEFPADTVEKVSASRDFFTKAFGWNYKQWGEEYVDTQDSGITSGVSISDSISWSRLATSSRSGPSNTCYT